MTMSNRILLLAALIALSQLGAQVADSHLALLPAMAPENDLADLPWTLGGWNGSDVSLPKEVADQLGDAEAFVNRSYRNQLGESIEVNVAAFTRYDLTPPHFLLDCYHGSGWELQSTRMLPLERNDEDQVAVTVYNFQRRGEHAMVAYWLQIGEEIVFDRDGVRRVQLGARARHTRMPLLKKVMLHTQLDTAERAELRLMSLARPLFDAVDAYK